MDPTILVVEDDPHLRELIADVLSDEGYDVHEAFDGQRALERFETIAPDLVLSDIRMPRLTGVELAERLNRRADPVPIVLMSTASTIPRTAGTLFLAKPFTLDELVSLVARILEKETRPGSNSPIAGKP